MDGRLGKIDVSKQVAAHGQSSPTSVVYGLHGEPETIHLPCAAKSAITREKSDIIVGKKHVIISHSFLTTIILLLGILATVMGLTVWKLFDRAAHLDGKLAFLEAERKEDLYLMKKLTEIVSTQRKQALSDDDADAAAMASTSTDEPKEHLRKHLHGWSQGASYHSYRSWTGGEAHGVSSSSVEQWVASVLLSSCRSCARGPLSSSTALMISLDACHGEEEEEEEVGIEVIDMDEILG